MVAFTYLVIAVWYTAWTATRYSGTLGAYPPVASIAALCIVGLLWPVSMLYRLLLE